MPPVDNGGLWHIVLMRTVIVRTPFTVAAINIMGDWLRDYLDPRLRVER
jgi:ABC-type dipeptide/oligopeptide/nickel transport system permease subunit